MAEDAENFSLGCLELGLCPEIEGEGKKWRFLGIQSRNCREWYTTQIANMHQNITTVALFDQNSKEATNFIIEETRLTTIACEVEKVSDIFALLDDHLWGPVSVKNKQTCNLKNLIVFGNESQLTLNVKEKIESGDLNIYFFDDIIKKGNEV